MDKDNVILCRTVVPLKSLGGAGGGIFGISVGVKLWARLLRSRRKTCSRLDGQAPLSPASINSMKSESWGWGVIVRDT